MQTIDFSLLKLSEFDVVLDLGCGQGRHALFAHFFTSAKRTVALDLNFADVQLARHHITQFGNAGKNKSCWQLVGNGCQLPFADNSFDVVVCSEVLEHVEFYEGMLAEMNRILKPGGKLAISVPRAWPEKICWLLSADYHNVPGGHIRIFNEKALSRKIQDLGFTLQLKHWAHALHAPYWWLRCLFWRYGESFVLARWYHAMLVWDLMKKPWLTRGIEHCLNPVMGKSVVLYFKKH